MDDFRSMIGQEVARLSGPDAVNLPMIRHWCELVEDANPLYTNEEYARRSEYGGIISPPPMLMTWAMPPPWSPTGERPRQVWETVHLPGFPATVDPSVEEEYYSPVRLGDRITAVKTITDISPLKRTRVGTGHFVTWVNTYYNQRGDTVGRLKAVVLKYRPEGAKPGKTFLPELAQEVPQGSLTPRSPDEPLFWEQVTEGDRILPIRMELNATRFAMLPGATRDFYPGHHDSEFARAHGTSGVFVNAPFLIRHGRSLPHRLVGTAWKDSAHRSADTDDDASGR